MRPWRFELSAIAVNGVNGDSALIGHSRKYLGTSSFYVQLHFCLSSLKVTAKQRFLSRPLVHNWPR